MATAVDSKYHSELFRDLEARARAEGEALGESIGEARGEARGEAKAVLTVLDARGVAVPDDLRDRILSCVDGDLLDTWLRRALAASTVDDVIRGQ